MRPRGGASSALSREMGTGIGAAKPEGGELAPGGLRRGALDEEIFEQLRALMRLAREHRLSEVSIESADVSVRLRRGGRRAPQPGPGPRPGATGAPAASRRVEEIRAPLIGIFYHAPAPDAPPYLEVGDWIEPGQTVGLIEAMKVFNEITSEIAGRVFAITARNGELVEAGQTLMVVELSE